MIRDPAQKPTITALGKDQPGKLEVLISSLEEIKTQAQAQSIIDSTSPNFVVFSAGSGGKGGPEMTLAIDRDACIAFVRASVATPSVTKFLVVSYIGSRKSKAPWWSEGEWKACQEVNNGVLKNYYPAKLAADECLTALSAKRGGWVCRDIVEAGKLDRRGRGGEGRSGTDSSKGECEEGRCRGSCGGVVGE